MILPEDKTRLQELIKKTRHLWKFLDCDEKKKSILELEETMSSPTFWNNQKEAKRVSSEANRLKQTVEKIESFRVQVEDLNALAELCDEDENDQEMES
jgi:peptide chain release factor 2